MITEEIPIENIIPYDKNNRIHNENQLSLIADSIKNFGMNQPVVIDENNILLVGHGRLFAAQKLGLKTIPCIKKTDLTETQKRAYRILDNKLQNDSTWDFANLEFEIEQLKEEDFDLEAWGLDKLLGIFPEQLQGTQQDSKKNQTLSDRFLIPPFSVFDARQGYWQERKRFWLSLGIKSELGRGGGLLKFSERCAISTGGKGTPKNAGYK